MSPVTGLLRYYSQRLTRRRRHVSLNSRGVWVRNRLSHPFHTRPLPDCLPGSGTRRHVPSTETMMNGLRSVLGVELLEGRTLPSGLGGGPHPPPPHGGPPPTASAAVLADLSQLQTDRDKLHADLETLG